MYDTYRDVEMWCVGSDRRHDSVAAAAGLDTSEV